MRVPAIAAAMVLAGAVISAQAPVPNPSGKAGAIGFMHAIHSTNDIEKTLAFYQAVFGLAGQVRPFQSILMRDPDGFFVEAIQGTPADGAGDGAVLGALIGLTVGDMDETLRYWNGLLGLDVVPDAAFSSDRAMLDLLGLPAGASYRLARGVVPGSTVRIEMIEIRGVPRKPFDLRVTDANARGIAMRVGRIQEVLARIKGAGGRVLSRNGELVAWSETVRNVFVKDPNGFNLELVGSANPAQ